MEIYIVEDDMSVISVLQDIIEDNDLGIVCGTSEGQPADVDDILAKNPDMVLIDFLMPEKDGVQEINQNHIRILCQDIIHIRRLSL